ncbi:hypothetical protein SKAU_G00318440 [Synaphobranchus kaupii]|uniref:Uncharacterized protein n=1 Tax=Synaphobranchus kaupii TaxID=118154 RepID=A0A9Q1IM25_SYNKA|nr:hypothetical protein SKAU_G00318440 [Synaphobranchus kaupii]
MRAQRGAQPSTPTPLRQHLGPKRSQPTFCDPEAVLLMEARLKEPVPLLIPKPLLSMCDPLAKRHRDTHRICGTRRETRPKLYLVRFGPRDWGSGGTHLRMGARDVLRGPLPEIASVSCRPAGETLCVVSP